MRVSRLLLPAVAVVAAVGAASASSAAPGARHPHLSERRILRIALTAARAAGDAKPTLIQHAAGTREAANRVDSGDIVPGRAWSYLIAERGHFVFSNAPTPPGAPAPRGTVLTIVINARTGLGTDDGLSDRYPDLARLGSITTDLRR